MDVGAQNFRRWWFEARFRARPKTVQRPVCCGSGASGSMCGRTSDRTPSAPSSTSASTSVPSSSTAVVAVLVSRMRATRAVGAGRARFALQRAGQVLPGHRPRHAALMGGIGGQAVAESAVRAVPVEPQQRERRGDDGLVGADGADRVHPVGVRAHHRAAADRGSGFEDRCGDSAAPQGERCRRSGDTGSGDDDVLDHGGTPSADGSVDGGVGSGIASSAVGCRISAGFGKNAPAV